LEAHFAAIPAEFTHWIPPSLDGPLTLRSLVYHLCRPDQQHLGGLQWLLGKIAATRA
jgi:hypothetical protein